MQGPVSESAQAKSDVEIKIYWNTATHTLFVQFSCFHATLVELSGCHKGFVVFET